MTPETITMIAVSEITPSPVNQRDAKVDIDALAANIKAHGLIEPIIVRPLEKGYELVDGERRWHAHKKLKLAEIPAIVRALDEKEAHSVMLSTFLHRKDLTPMQEAAAIQVLISDGKAPKDIAAEIGWPVSRVARRAALLNLSENWKKTAAGKNQNCRGVVTTGALELVARLDKETQERVFAEVDLWQGLDVKGMAEALDGFMLTLSAAPWGLEDGTLDGPSCKDCDKRTGCQPDLFGEDNGKKAADKCLDRDCWHKKQAAFLERKVREARERNEGLVLLTNMGGRHGPDDPFRDAISLHSGGIEEVTKKTPGAREAIQIDGPDAGKTTYIKMDKAAEKKAGEKAGKTMKEKREALERRRSLAMISKAKDYLLTGKSDTPISENEALALAAIFGSKQPEGHMSLKDAVKRGTGKEGQIIGHILTGAQLYAADFLDGMVYQNPINRKDIETVCGLCGINWQGLVEKIETDIPEPKSWKGEKVEKKAKAKGKK